MVINKYGFLRFHIDVVDHRGVLGLGLPHRLRAVVRKGEEESAGKAVHQVAHLHHFLEDRVLCVGYRRDHSLRHSLHVGVQALPFPTRKCSTFPFTQISHEIYKRLQKHL